MSELWREAGAWGQRTIDRVAPAVLAPMDPADVVVDTTEVGEYTNDMTTTTAPARHFGKCPVGGCKTRAVVAPVAIEQTPRRERLVLPAGWIAEGVTVDAGAAFCSADGFPIKWQGLKATVNTTECGARCQDSTRPVCKCSCGGERHGERA